jgi:hypothetical protein
MTEKKPNERAPNHTNTPTHETFAARIDKLADEIVEQGGRFDE